MPAKKPFPITTFANAFAFAQGIATLGTDEPIKRLTLLDLLGKRPNSSKTRDLITHSGAYGLTKGGYSAEFIELTGDGRVAVDDSDPVRQRRKHFELAITRIAPFNEIFERYKGKSVPANALLKDALEQVGITSTDTEKAISTLKSNMEYVGAITKVTGQPHIDVPSFDAPDAPSVSAGGSEGDAAPDEANGKPSDRDADQSRDATSFPQLHIDVQVHIDSTASSEQIEQIFKSMATHLYGRGDA